MRLMAMMLLSTIGAACQPAPLDQGGLRRYALVGTLVSVDAARSEITIAHEPVEGFMPAMTMPFRVKGVPPGAETGDRVAATLVVSTDASWIEGLAITKPAARTVPAAAMNGPGARSGLKVPDFALMNQDGKPFTFRDIEGQIILLTFIYTRCPLPDYCPLMMKHFDAVRRALRAEPGVWTRVRLISVTLDPVYDSPDVLRAYGEKVIKGPDPFDRWDLATGTPAEIQRMASYFGVTSRPEAGVLIHSLQTAILDRDGRPVKLFPENWWQPADVAAEVRRLVQAESAPGR